MANVYESSERTLKCFVGAYGNPAPRPPPRRHIQATVLGINEGDGKGKATLLSSPGQPKEFKIGLSEVTGERGEAPPRPNSPCLNLSGVKSQPRLQGMQSARGARSLESSFPLTCSTPRVRRHYLPSTIEKTAPSFINSYAIQKKEQKRNEKALCKFMQKGWETTECQPINGTVIEQQVLKLYCKESESYFLMKKNPSERDLQLSRSSRVKKLEVITQKSGFILLPVIERLNIYRTILLNYISLIAFVTPNMKKLVDFLDKFILSEDYSGSSDFYGLEKGKGLEKFLQTWEEFTSTKPMSRFVKLIENAFGESPVTRKEVLAELNKWNKAPVEMLKANLERLDEESNIPYIKHEWKESPETKNPISSITPKEIIRSLRTTEGIPAKKIVINGKVIYEDRGSSPPPQSDEEKNIFEKTYSGPSLLSREEFLCYVFEELYAAGLDIEKDSEEIKNEFSQLLEWEKLSTEEQNLNQKKAPIPCLEVLRFCTNSAWLKADCNIRNLYPKLFGNLYWTKAAGQSMEYHISINKSGSPKVKIIRDYCVFHREIPTSETVDRKRPLMKLKFYWELTENQGQPKGELWINGHELFPRGSKDKRSILDGLIHYTEVDKSVASAPETLK